MTPAAHPALDAPSQPPTTAPPSIEDLFESLESPLLAYALRITCLRPVAEDIVQEAFLRLHAQTQPILDPRRWLYRTVHNLSINHRRQSGRAVPLDDGSPQPPSPDSSAPNAPAASSPLTDSNPLPDELAARLEGISLVRSSLHALDSRTREIIHLKFDENLSYKEISAKTGLTTGHVGYLLHHALKTLSSELARAGLLP